jgi:hypothetical protein
VRAVFWRFFVSTCLIYAFDLNVFAFYSPVFGELIRIFVYPNIGIHRVSVEKQLTMPPQKRSKKNIPTETDQEENHHVDGDEISLAPEPSNITD